MHTNLARKSVINFISKVYGGRSSKQMLPAALAMCFLFGLLFLLRKHVGLSSSCAIPFGLSVINLLFYSVGLISKQESLNKRLFNQLLFCLIFSLGSLYLSILFIYTTNATYTFVFSLIFIIVYFVLVIISIGVEEHKLLHGKYETRQTKTTMPSSFIYVVSALLGVFLSKLIQNTSKNEKNINIIIPYVFTLIFLIISFFLIPFFSNILRIYFAKKLEIDLNEVNHLEPSNKGLLALSNKKRLINCIVIGSIFYAGIIVQTLGMNSHLILFKKKVVVLIFICLFFILNQFVNMFNAFHKMDNAKNSFLAILLVYITSIAYFVVTIVLLNKTNLMICFEPIMLKLNFLFSIVISSVVSIVLSLIIFHFKRK